MYGRLSAVYIVHDLILSSVMLEADPNFISGAEDAHIGR